MKYLEWLKETTGVGSLAELKREDLIDNNGHRLLRLYGYSLQRVLDSLNEDKDTTIKKTVISKEFKQYYYWVRHLLLLLPFPILFSGLISPLRIA